MKQNIMTMLATLASLEMLNENNHYQSPFNAGIQEVQKELQDLQKDNQRLEAAEAKRERKRLKRLSILTKQKDLTS